MTPPSDTTIVPRALPKLFNWEHVRRKQGECWPRASKTGVSNTSNEQCGDVSTATGNRQRTSERCGQIFLYLIWGGAYFLCIFLMLLRYMGVGTACRAFQTPPKTP
jgi:hypothetical protein